MINERDRMHPHLSREAIVRDVEATRYGWHYAGKRKKIMHVVRMEDGGNELPFEPEEIHIVEDWD